MTRIFQKLKNDARIKNSLWMLVEKSISLFGLIFIISAVAKYTGPAIYGEISLAASIFIVLKTISQLGLDQIYFKYVSEKKPYYNVFIINAVKLVSLLFISFFILITIWALNFTSSTGFWFIFCTGVAYYFNSVDLINYFNEGRLLSKLNVIANTLGLIIALVLRYLIVLFEMDVLYLCLPIIIMTLIPFLIKIYYHIEFFSKAKVVKNKKSKKYYKYFLYMGIPLTLSILTVSLNSQVANYLLAYFYGPSSVGVYSVAFILAGAWCIIPTTIAISFLTTIYVVIDIKNYILLARKILFSLIFISILLIFVLFIFGDLIINLLYGAQYVDSISIFRILLFYQFFWVLGFYFSRLIIKFGGFKFLAYKSIISCIFNLILSIYMIKNYGVAGAALSVLISEFFSAFILNLLYRKAYLIEIINPFRS